MSKSPSSPTYPNPPIVEAVLDIGCDFAANFDLAEIEAVAREAFRETYPKYRKNVLVKGTFHVTGDGEPSADFEQGQDLDAFQFLENDDRQLVQIRPSGFSFNRLAPYTSLDDYLSEIERCWKIFGELTQVVQIRHVRLRYINRILLPKEPKRIDLNDYFTCGPRTPDSQTMIITGFLNQMEAFDTATGYKIFTVLTREQATAEHRPIIFDQSVLAEMDIEPDDWRTVSETISSLRDLKNRVFEETLTERCKTLFQD